VVPVVSAVNPEFRDFIFQTSYLKPYSLGGSEHFLKRKSGISQTSGGLGEGEGEGGTN